MSTLAGFRYSIKCIGQTPIPAEFDHSVTLVLKNLGASVDQVKQSGVRRTYEVSSSTELSWELLKESLISLTQKHRIDFSFNSHARDVKLMVFDMDSTLIDAEVIDEMGKVLGIGSKIAAITERAMNGELNFDQSLVERVALLKGMPTSQMEVIYQSLKVNPGVSELMQKVSAMGIKTIIISGGFNYFAESVKTKLGMTQAYANELEFSDGKLTGKVLGNIINAASKSEILTKIAQENNFALHQVVAVGDGANDLLMLNAAGMGVAWHAKEKVKQAVPHHISFGPMTNLLFFLGLE